MGTGIIVRLVRVQACDLSFLPCTLRVPLKFGAETIASIVNARVCLHLADDHGRIAKGWGETPLSVAWAWPSPAPFTHREQRMREFCGRLADAWRETGGDGHALEIGWEFLERTLPGLRASSNAGQALPMPHLAALICNSAFDLALHDAYGKLLGKSVYETYNRRTLRHDLAGAFPICESL